MLDEERESILIKFDKQVFKELEIIRLANGGEHQERGWMEWSTSLYNNLVDLRQYSPFTTAAPGTSAALGFTVTLTCALLVTSCLGLAASGPIGWAALAIGAVFMGLHLWNVYNKAKLPTSSEQTEKQIEVLKEWDQIKKTEHNEKVQKQEEIIGNNREHLETFTSKAQKSINEKNSALGEGEKVDFKQLKTFIDLNVKKETLESSDENQRAINSEIEEFDVFYKNFYAHNKDACKDFAATYLKTEKAKKTKEEIKTEYEQSQSEISNNIKYLRENPVKNSPKLAGDDQYFARNSPRN